MKKKEFIMLMLIIVFKTQSNINWKLVDTSFLKRKLQKIYEIASVVSDINKEELNE